MPLVVNKHVHLQSINELESSSCVILPACAYVVIKQNYCRNTFTLQLEMCMICCWCCWCSSHHHHHHLHGYHYDLIFVNFLWRSSPISGLGRLIVELSRSHTVIHVHMHTPGRISLNEWPNCRRGHYLHNTKQTQQTKIPAPSGIRTRDPSNQVAAVLLLRPRDYRNCHFSSYLVE